MFGELLGVWIYNELVNTGFKGEWQLIELGPGTGALMKDILEVLYKFAPHNFSVNLVETSEALMEVQKSKLHALVNFESGAPIFWHKSLDEVPEAKFSVFIANEFFDALPIHQFMSMEDGHNNKRIWREVYVNLRTDDADEKLCFMLSRGENINTLGLIPEKIRDVRLQY